MSGNAGPEPTAKSSTLWSWLLIASLMANVILLGAAAGSFLGGAGPGHHREGRKGPLSRYVETLLPERRAELDKILDAKAEEMKSRWTEVRTARSAVMDVIGAEALDQAKLEAALAAMGGADARLRETRSRKFVEVISAMTAEERRAFRDQRKDMEQRRKH